MINSESFVPIKEFKNYGINELGEVINFKTKKILKPKVNKKNKVRIISLFDYFGMKHEFSLHRLVAIAFIPNPNYLPYVVHLDKNKNNNRASNLIWCDEYYVARNRKTTKLTINDVFSIHRMLANNKKQKDIAKQFLVDPTTINNIKKGKIYPDLLKKYNATLPVF